MRTKIKIYKRNIKSHQGPSERIHDDANLDKNFDYVAKAPQNFSLINNTTESVNYFKHVIDYIHRPIRKNKHIVKIFFDLNHVKNITIDCVMYLLAIVTNFKAYSKCDYMFWGNLPIEEEGRKLLSESGFLNYLETTDETPCNHASNRIKIQYDSAYDEEFIKSICLFTQDKLKTNRVGTQRLSGVIGEIMTNVTKHAYTDNTFKKKFWYLFTEYKTDKICYTILDTGDGIPKTLHKKLTEKFFGKDCELIISALNANRSNTKLPYRGKGLPSIYEAYLDGKISNLFILSGKGLCNFNNGNNEDNPDSKEIKHKLDGTIFYWEIDSNNLLEED